MPHIDGLRIPEILAFAREHWEIDKYMPEYESDKYHPENGSVISVCLQEWP